jgi:hypothetical protein
MVKKMVPIGRGTIGIGGGYSAGFSRWISGRLGSCGASIDIFGGRLIGSTTKPGTHRHAPVINYQKNFAALPGAMLFQHRQKCS